MTALLPQHAPGTPGAAAMQGRGVADQVQVSATLGAPACAVSSLPKPRYGLAELRLAMDPSAYPEPSPVCGKASVRVVVHAVR